MNHVGLQNGFTCYDERYKTFPRSDISKLTAIEIKENGRNYRSQREHLLRARTLQECR